MEGLNAPAVPHDRTIEPVPIPVPPAHVVLDYVADVTFTEDDEYVFAALCELVREGNGSLAAVIADPKTSEPASAGEAHPVENDAPSPQPDEEDGVAGVNDAAPPPPGSTKEEQVRHLREVLFQQEYSP